MSQFGMQPNVANPSLPMTTGYGQNVTPMNYVANQPSNFGVSQSNMIMATPGPVVNNQSQIQNQPQNANQGSYQQTYLPGRLVNSPDEIGVIEVPMNAAMSVFPKPDRTEIYVKYWTEQGVQTETFVRKDPEQPKINASESDILNALNSIMERVSRLETAQQTKTTKKVNKEEVV